MSRRHFTAFTAGLLAVESVFGNDPACPDPGQLYAQCITFEGLMVSPWVSDARLGACADNFALADRRDIRRIRWWGFYAHLENCGPLDDDFIVNLWSNNEGVPAAPMIPLPSSHTVTRSTEPVGEFITGLMPLQVYEYELTLDGDPFEAVADVTYWLEIYNDLGGDPANCFWHWVGAPAAPTEAARSPRSGTSRSRWE